MFIGNPRSARRLAPLLLGLALLPWLPARQSLAAHPAPAARVVVSERGASIPPAVADLTLGNPAPGGQSRP